MNKNVPLELETNSINFLFSQFEDLLLGLDTKKEKFVSESKKTEIINLIKNHTKYRLKEKKISNSPVWKILLKIEKLDFNKIKEIKKIHSILFNMKKPKTKSRYLKQKSKEEGEFKGFNAIKNLFGLK